MSKAAICILVVAVPGSSCATAWSQVEKASEYQVRAVFLYNFAKFVEGDQGSRIGPAGVNEYGYG